MTPLEREQGAIAFAEKVLELLEEGRYTATYKYAVLLALLDLSLEHAERTGAPPEILTTLQVANKVVEIYWPQASPFPGARTASVLRQNTRGQAEILALIARFRSGHAGDVSTSIWEARRLAPAQFERLVRTVEWKLIEMPLPRLQTIGDGKHEFIYAPGWDAPPLLRDVRRYQSGAGDAFDNRLLLRPGVGGYLRQLNGLLRPLLHRRWATMVARLNGHDDAKLEDFLFGAERIDTSKVRRDLWLLQARRCFYCDTGADLDYTEVDHFIPWARYPDDGLDNLVVADKRCNGAKRAFLAAAKHVVRWAPRVDSASQDHARLGEISGIHGWERHPDRTLNVARAIYHALPDDARLWVHRREFADVDRPALMAALGPGT